MFRKLSLSFVLGLVLSLSMVGIGSASDVVVAGISIPQVDEPDFQTLFPDSPNWGAGDASGGRVCGFKP